MPEFDSLGSAAGKLGSALREKDTCAQGAARAITEAGCAVQEDLAHALTSMAEHGKGVLVEQVMFGLSSGERIDMLRQMDRINEEHRRTNHDLPDLVINYDKKGYSVAVDYPGNKDDLVIWAASVDKNDNLTNVVCRTAKDYPHPAVPAPPDMQPQGQGGRSQVEDYRRKAHAQKQVEKATLEQ